MVCLSCEYISVSYSYSYYYTIKYSRSDISEVKKYAGNAETFPAYTLSWDIVQFKLHECR